MFFYVKKTKNHNSKSVKKRQNPAYEKKDIEKKNKRINEFSVYRIVSAKSY